MILSADGCRDLEEQLSSIDISVPPREEGRTTADCERWSIMRFLAALNNASELQFPLTVTKRERPDFSVEVGTEIWGVEITEAIPTAYARALTIAAKENPEAMIDISLFKYGEDKSLEEIREIVNASKLTGPGWVGKGAEKELSQAISQAVLIKTQKLRKRGFSKFPSNILLIYENMPLPSLDLNAVLALIAEELSTYWGSEETFHRVYIESGQKMIAFSANSHYAIEIPKLW